MSSFTVTAHDGLTVTARPFTGLGLLFALARKRPSLIQSKTLVVSNITYSLDHLVLTVMDVDNAVSFYSKALGMGVVTFGNDRKALSFGSQKINLHQQGKEFEPKEQRPTPGSADLCFLTSTPLQDVLIHLNACGIEVIDGPVQPKKIS